MGRMLLFSVICALAGTSGVSQAHEFWIEPPSPVEGTQVQLIQYVGDGFPGQAYPRNEAHIERFDVIGPAKTQAATGRHGQTPAGQVRLDQGGVHMAVYRSLPTEAQIDAKMFNEYLLADGLDHVFVERARRGQEDDPGLEAFSRCAKTIWRHRTGPDHVATAVAGLRFEIVPATNPLDLEPNKRFQVTVLLDGEPARDITLHSFRRGIDGPVERARTNSKGQATFDIGAAGTWLISGVHMEAVAPPANVQWTSVWTSLTFTR